MQTKWDYSELAEAYLKRPNYSVDAIDRCLNQMNLPESARVCDVGAGVAHLTLELARRNFVEVVAVEPNDQMRALGRKRTQSLAQVSWHEGTGEQTGQAEHIFDLVTFGSSFNVCDQQAALQETDRLLKSGGWFVCRWNHRDLEDPLQAEIENTIRRFVPEYGYGRRREDQTDEINKSGLFLDVQTVSGRVVHQQSIADCITAWRSHATLHRQAGERFAEIITAIETLLNTRLEGKDLSIPYDTRIWFAQRKA